jgi:hypothetical protein
LLENLALRHQLTVLKRSVPRPKFNNSDRLFWAWLLFNELRGASTRDWSKVAGGAVAIVGGAACWPTRPRTRTWPRGRRLAVKVGMMLGGIKTYETAEQLKVDLLRGR